MIVILPFPVNFKLVFRLEAASLADLAEAGVNVYMFAFGVDVNKRAIR